MRCAPTIIVVIAAIGALAAGCSSDAHINPLRTQNPPPAPAPGYGELDLVPGGAPADDSGRDGGRDSGEPADSGQPVDADRPSRCLTWESATLFDAGYTGDFVELWDGALVLIAEQGVTTYSALTGENELEYRDDHALVLRSSHDGSVESVAIATTPPFTIQDWDGAAHMWWWQLSEVDQDGVRLYADLINTDGTIVASLDIPVETGGFVPGLLDEHQPIDGFDEIDYGAGQPGELVQQIADLSPFIGQDLRLRIYQHTEVENNGFFTVFDDICVGHAAADPSLTWGPPDPSH